MGLRWFDCDLRSEPLCVKDAFSQTPSRKCGVKDRAWCERVLTILLIAPDQEGTPVRGSAPEIAVCGVAERGRLAPASAGFHPHSITPSASPGPRSALRGSTNKRPTASGTTPARRTG